MKLDKNIIIVSNGKATAILYDDKTLVRCNHAEFTANAYPREVTFECNKGLESQWDIEHERDHFFKAAERILGYKLGDDFKQP